MPKETHNIEGEPVVLGKCTILGSRTFSKRGSNSDVFS